MRLEPCALAPQESLLRNSYSLIQKPDHLNNVLGNLELFLDASDGIRNLRTCSAKVTDSAISSAEPLLHNPADEDVNFR